MAKSRAARMGLTKQDLIKRVDRALQPVSPARAPLTFVREIHAQIAGVLFELGVPLPFWLVIPNPLRRNFSRQNVFTLQPRGTAGDNLTFTFQAREKGFLVLNDIEVAPQDGLAFETMEIQFEMTNRRNNVDYSLEPGKAADEPQNFWKFSKWVGFDGEFLKINVRNNDEFGVIVFALEVGGWEV